MFYTVINLNFQGGSYTIVSQERARYGLFAHPQFSLDFLLRSTTYLKEHPPSASITNRDFPLSSRFEHVVRLVCTHYKVQIMLLHSGLHYLAHDVMYYLHC